jgi:hypothetical protein
LYVFISFLVARNVVCAVFIFIAQASVHVWSLA